MEGVAGGKERRKRWRWICYTEESIMLQRLAVLLQQQSSCKGVVASAFWSARHLHSVLQAESSVNKAASSENNNKPRRIDSLARQVSRLIKQNKEDVATGLLPQMAAQERPPTVVYCNYLLNSCARARNPTVSLMFSISLFSVYVFLSVCPFPCIFDCHILWFWYASVCDLECDHALLLLP